MTLFKKAFQIYQNLQLARSREARPSGDAFGSRSGGCHAAHMFYPFHRFHPCEFLTHAFSESVKLRVALRGRLLSFSNRVVDLLHVFLYLGQSRL